MLSFAQVEAAVVRCFSLPSVLDEMPSQPETLSYRVAPDELMLLGPPSTRANIVAGVTHFIAEADPHALTIVQADAWSIWALTGDDRRRAFARLSPIQLPESPAFLQGGVAHVPAKTLVLSDTLYIMVSSTLGHHLRTRILAACADLNPREDSPTPLTVSPARVDAVS